MPRPSSSHQVFGPMREISWGGSDEGSEGRVGREGREGKGGE